ncbi:MAG: flagellar hook-basal body complex protein FliE [Acidobacteriaceae bacterium]|nr:flagellar hook-basal body complex protein FliE [Acidobacteriaceae bacterium]MBV8569042.1 flagellar hook-basal body complex protein FliE [Acidobacteriaceae bacterium]
MSLPISGIAGFRPIQPVETADKTSGAGAFQSVLQSAIQRVESSSAAAESQIQDFLSGSSQDLHTAILATQSAQLNLDEFLQVRNKVVSAYEEIMKMQV